MVPQFLLHDAAEMSIGGIIGKRKVSLWEGCWRGTATARRRFAFWKAYCAVAVHSNIFAPPPPSGYWLKGATPVHNLEKNSGKSLPWQENVAVAWCPEVPVRNFHWTFLPVTIGLKADKLFVHPKNEYLDSKLGLNVTMWHLVSL